MSDKSPEKDGLLELLKKLWLPVAGFLGAVSLAYNFYQLWLGDQATVTWFLAGGGLVVLVIALAWVVFSKKTEVTGPERPFGQKRRNVLHRYPSIARLVTGAMLVIVAAGGVGGGISVIKHRQALEEKLVVLIAAFEGPEDVYGLRNEIVEKLNVDFASDSNVRIETVEETITPDNNSGSSRARDLGKKFQADVVIWGWYRPTENPNVTIHLENQNPDQLLILSESETFRPRTELANMEAFSFQYQTGQETSALISFLAGYIDCNSRNYKKAIESFDLALAKQTVDPQLVDMRSDIYLYRGITNFDLGDYQSAIQDYKQSIELSPQNSQAYNNLGNVYVQLGDYQRAIENYGKAIEIQPFDAIAYNNRGNLYSELSDYHNAIKDLDQAIQINPRFATAYNNRGVVYSILEDYQLAINDFNQAIQIDSGLVEAYFNLGGANASLGDYQHAIQNYRHVILIDSQDFYAFVYRGKAYSNLGKNRKALQDFNHAIQINPQFSEAYFSRGNAYSDLYQYQSAIKDYSHAILINPRFSEAYYNRGNAYLKIGEFLLAIQDYDEAIHLVPQFEDAYNNRGFAYVQLNEYQLAIQDYNRAIQINPNLAETYNNRGEIFQKLGETNKAEADFAKYKELTGKDVPTLIP